MLLSVVIPCYMEGIAIKQSVETIAKILKNSGLPEDQFEIILVIEKSYSAAQAYADRLQAEYPYVIAIPNDARYGKGYSVKRGIMHSRGEKVLTMDADLPVDISKYYPMMELLSQSPKVGAVYVTALGDKTSRRKRGFVRAVTTFCLFILRNCLLHVHITDTQLGCKLYQGDVIRRIMPHVTERGFLYELQVTDLLTYSGYEIEECAARIGRFSEESSVTLRSIGRNAVVFAKYLFRRRSQMLLQAGLLPPKSKYRLLKITLLTLLAIGAIIGGYRAFAVTNTDYNLQVIDTQTTQTTVTTNGVGPYGDPHGCKKKC